MVLQTFKGRTGHTGSKLDYTWKVMVQKNEKKRHDGTSSTGVAWKGFLGKCRYIHTRIHKMLHWGKNAPRKLKALWCFAAPSMSPFSQLHQYISFNKDSEAIRDKEFEKICFGKPPNAWEPHANGVDLERWYPAGLKNFPHHPKPLQCFFDSAADMAQQSQRKTYHDLSPSSSNSRALIRSSFSALLCRPLRVVFKVSTSAESWAILSVCALMVRVCSSRRDLISWR